MRITPMTRGIFGFKLCRIWPERITEITENPSFVRRYRNIWIELFPGKEAQIVHIRIGQDS